MRQTAEKTLTPDDIGSILNEILPTMSKSRFIGLALGVPYHKVDSIHTQHGDPQKCLCFVLVEFLRRLRPTWRAIVNALKSPMVDFPALAQELESRHCLSLTRMESPSKVKKGKQDPTMPATASSEYIHNVLYVCSSMVRLLYMYYYIPYREEVGFSSRSSGCGSEI